MSFKPQVIADSSGQWADNALRFATENEAKIWNLDLSRRWFLVSKCRVVEVDEPVTAKLEEVEPGTWKLIMLQ